ncbi:MAG TPA: hypothetical protein VG052_01275 [Puia sp.]|jgi:hypothetical protein|nr:hypothetical protein [Puia sp.]
MNLKICFRISQGLEMGRGEENRGTGKENSGAGRGEQEKNKRAIEIALASRLVTIQN